MFRIKVAELGIPALSSDDTVIKAENKQDLKKNLGSYLATSHPAAWAAMSEAQREKLAERAKNSMESR